MICDCAPQVAEPYFADSGSTVSLKKWAGSKRRSLVLHMYLPLPQSASCDVSLSSAPTHNGREIKSRLSVYSDESTAGFHQHINLLSCEGFATESSIPLNTQIVRNAIPPGWRARRRRQQLFLPGIDEWDVGSRQEEGRAVNAGLP